MTTQPPKPTNAPVPTASTSAPLRFPPHSRYAGTEVVTRPERDGSETRYLKRRFISETGRTPTVAEHLVVEGDRADLLAQTYYGDPLLAWRIADANEAADFADLTAAPGRIVIVPAPDASDGFGGATR